MAPAHTSVGSLGTVLAGREADRGAALNVAAEGTRRRVPRALTCALNQHRCKDGEDDRRGDERPRSDFESLAAARQGLDARSDRARVLALLRAFRPASRYAHARPLRPLARPACARGGRHGAAGKYPSSSRKT